ncbi:hypothetical protein NMG60_11017166 [Bertholletia excelsa]
MAQFQGRGSARLGMAVGVILLCLLVHSVPAHAAVYTVGGSSGWSLTSGNWPKGKRFRAGDVLVFNYDSTSHNVVAVDRRGYTSCTSPAGAKVYNTGKDQVTLGKGINYFICSFPGHCQSGMKMAIAAV